MTQTTKTHMIRNVFLAGTAFLLGGIASMPGAHAAGFFVQELSTSGQGTSYAGQAATTRDSTIIFHNPAGITHLDSAQFNAGIHALYVETDLIDLGSTVPASFNDNGGNPSGLNIVPNLYVAAPLDNEKKLWAGLAITSPFGLGVDHDDNFFGGFTGQDVELKTIDFLPTLAYQVNDWLSIGASAIIQYADINFQAIVPTVEFLRLTADDLAYGYQLGTTITPNEDLTVGISYRSGVNIDFKGDISPTNFLSGGIATPGVGTLNLPDIANFAVSYDVDETWTLLSSIVWYGWSNTDQVIVIPGTPGIVSSLPVSFQYENTLNFTLGAEYKYNDRWTYRAGYQFDETPTTAAGRSTINPDGDRHWFSGGGTYKYNEKWSFDFAATYIEIEDGNINQDRGAFNVLAEADDSFSIIASFGINYKF